MIRREKLIFPLSIHRGFSGFNYLFFFLLLRTIKNYGGEGKLKSLKMALKKKNKINRFETNFILSRASFQNKKKKFQSNEG